MNPYDKHPSIAPLLHTKKNVAVKDVLLLLEEALIDASNSFEFGHLSGEAFTAIVECLGKVKDKLER